MNTQLDELVYLSEPSDDWAAVFSAESARLHQALTATIEHIGSTAVPGLLAKPIVDIQVGVPEYPPSLALVEALGRLGYKNFGEAGVSGRLYFGFRGDRAFNVHVVQIDGQHWRNNLALRDLLRRSASAREQYTRAKVAAAEGGATTLLAYSAAKASVVASLLSRALSERE
jgi:GrpB-like predicted nucleotidyltransferase (UPF0157 family)